MLIITGRWNKILRRKLPAGKLGGMWCPICSICSMVS